MFLSPLAGDMFIQTRLSVAHVPKTHTLQVLVDALVSTASCGHKSAQHDSVLNQGRSDISQHQVDCLTYEAQTCCSESTYCSLLSGCRVSGYSLDVWYCLLLCCTRLAYHDQYYTQFCMQPVSVAGVTQRCNKQGMQDI